MIDDTVAAMLGAFEAVWIDALAEGCPADAVWCRRCESMIVRPPADDALSLADLAMICASHQCAPQPEQIRMLTIAQAAEVAELDADHVRRWCINGDVQAVKARGRWLIEQESLLVRLAVLDDLIDVLVGAGGSLWRKEGTCRVYFNEFWGWAGLAFPDPKVEKDGHVILDGKQVSIGKDFGLLRSKVDRVHVDLFGNRLVFQHYAGIKSVSYTDTKGKAHTLQLLGRLCAGFTRATGLSLGTPERMEEYHRSGTSIPILTVGQEAS